MTRNHFASTKNSSAAAAALSLLMAMSGASAALAQSASAHSATPAAAQQPSTQSKFYCNIKALTPDERGRHQKLTEKLIASRSAIVETETGYEFQFTPASISLAELADWAAAESKCCPFFDFHLDLEREGALLCLRLTGEQGIKPFIRGEFQVPPK
jgi:hypothetical protein